MKTTTCRSCGHNIIWCVLPSGKRCPMDATPYNLATFTPGSVPVYSLDEMGGDVEATRLQTSELLESTQFYVSHFATCPHAASHSKRQGAADTALLQWMAFVIGLLAMSMLVRHNTGLENEQALLDKLSSAQAQYTDLEQRHVQLQRGHAVLARQAAERAQKDARMQALIKQGKALPLPLPEGF